MSDQEQSGLTYGTPVWLEIPATDVLRAKTFYGNVFNWQFMTASEKMALFQVPDQRMTKLGFAGGGIVHVDGSKDGTGYPTTRLAQLYMNVKNIETTLELITSERGKVIKPRTPEPDGSSIAHFHDTEGNLQGLYEAAPSA